MRNCACSWVARGRGSYCHPLHKDFLSHLGEENKKNLTTKSFTQENTESVGVIEIIVIITWNRSKLCHLPEPWKGLRARFKEWHHEVWFLLAVSLWIEHSVPLGPVEKSRSQRLKILHPSLPRISPSHCVEAHYLQFILAEPCPELKIHSFVWQCRVLYRVQI